jgi:hypothetical protein
MDSAVVYHRAVMQRGNSPMAEAVFEESCALALLWHFLPR